MPVRFPFVKRRDPALSDITGFNGGNLQDQLDRQPQYSDEDPNTGFDYSQSPPDRMSGVRSAYPNIPDYVAPVEPSSAPEEPTTATPAVDPALLASLGTVAPVTMPAPAPIMVRHPGEQLGKPTRPTREGMIGATNAEDANRAYGEAVDQYTPQREPKWKRYLRIAAGVGGMFAGAFGRDSAAASRAAQAVGANVADPTFIDRGWREQEQKDVADQENRYLGRRRVEATIKNLEDQPLERAAREKRLQQGVDTRGQAVSNARLKAALDVYHKQEDYEPGVNPALDQYFEDSGLHGLGPHKAADKWQYLWVNGTLMKAAKSGNTPVSEATTGTGGKVADPSRTADQSVKLPNGTILDNLTPREAAAWEGKVYESDADRKSREGIAARAQAGATARAGMRGNGSAINSSVKGAISGLSKFRQMTANIEKQKAYYGPNADDPSTSEYRAIQGLYQQRDAFESDLKKVYGQYIELDDNKKPKGLRDDAVQSSPGANLTIQGAIDSFKVKNKRAPTAKEIANMQAAINALQ